MKKLGRKLVALVLCLSLSMGTFGCYAVCNTLTPDRMATAQELVGRIQANYGVLVDLANAANSVVGDNNPTVDLWVKVAGPLMIALADAALKGLGKMLADGCDDPAVLALAQINVNKIDSTLSNAPKAAALKFNLKR